MKKFKSSADIQLELWINKLDGVRRANAPRSVVLEFVHLTNSRRSSMASEPTLEIRTTNDKS
jgi:hypothetical protein